MDKAFEDQIYAPPEVQWERYQATQDNLDAKAIWGAVFVLGLILAAWVAAHPMWHPGMVAN